MLRKTMMSSISRFSLVVGVLLAAVASAQQAGSGLNSPDVLTVQGGKIRVVTIAGGLFHPWSLAFVDARTMLVTERNGRLRMIRDGALLPEPVWTSPSAAGEGGDALHFIAIHPKFSENQLVYVSYPKRDGDRVTLAVARGR